VGFSGWISKKRPFKAFATSLNADRIAVKLTQPDAEVRDRLRPDYAESAGSLIAVSQVVATHFATVAAANDYWKEKT
jgi:hypothetical protein